jgi:hypothetical protein
MEGDGAMNCQQAHELLEQHADRELTAARNALVDEHLTVCSACRRQHSALLEVRAALAIYPRINASPDFDMGVLDRVLPQLAQSDSLFDRLDAIFARPLYKLLGSGTIGAGIGLLILTVLSPPAPDGSIQAPTAPANMTLMTDLDTAGTLRQYYARNQWQTAFIGYGDLEWAPKPDRPAHNPAQAPLPESSRPTVSRKEKTPWDANTSALPSSSRPGSLC